MQYLLTWALHVYFISVESRFVSRDFANVVNSTRSQIIVYRLYRLYMYISITSKKARQYDAMQMSVFRVQAIP